MINIERIKNVREDNDLSQDEVAQILNIPRSTYSMYELGICIIPINLLSILSDYFNLSIDYLLGLTNKKSNNTNKGFDLKTLGNNLKEIRISNNLSQENIANMLKLKQASICKYEKAKVCISTSNLCKYAEFFNVSLNYLCGKSQR